MDYKIVHGITSHTREGDTVVVHRDHHGTGVIVAINDDRDRVIVRMDDDPEHFVEADADEIVIEANFPPDDASFWDPYG